jgi:hypothetical protein
VLGTAGLGSLSPASATRSAVALPASRLSSQTSSPSLDPLFPATSDVQPSSSGGKGTSSDIATGSTTSTSLASTGGAPHQGGSAGGPGPGNPPPPPSGGCPQDLPGCESLLAFNDASSSSPPAPALGQTATFYYEDETPIYDPSAPSSATAPLNPTSQACQSSQPLPGPGGSSTAPSLTLTSTNRSSTSVPLTLQTLYAVSTCGGSESNFQYHAEYSLLQQLKAVNPSYAGSTPNASANDVTSGGEGGNELPWVSKLSFTMPSSLAAGTYTATLHVFDSDGNQDQYSWSFTVFAPSCQLGTIYNLGHLGTLYALDTASAINTVITSLGAPTLDGRSGQWNGLGMSSTTFYAMGLGLDNSSGDTEVLSYDATTGIKKNKKQRIK